VDRVDFAAPLLAMDVGPIVAAVIGLGVLIGFNWFFMRHVHGLTFWKLAFLCTTVFVGVIIYNWRFA
jgi:hypothetical protein